MKHKLLYLLPIPALLAGLTACTTVHEREYPPRDRAPHYEPGPVYGEYDYYFYPGVAVYFQISTGFYFYEERGRWIRVRQLPPHIHLDSRYRRQLHIRDPYPYVRYTEHARLYGSRVDERDRRDDDRNGRGPERETREERESKAYREREERRAPPMENRGQERKDQVVPGRGPDDDRRGAKPQDSRRDDDRPQAYERERAKDGKPDARGPSQDDASPQKARGREERGDAKDASPPGKSEGSSRHGSGKPDDKGGKGRGADGKDDDDEDRDRGSPSSK